MAYKALYNKSDSYQYPRFIAIATLRYKTKENKNIFLKNALFQFWIKPKFNIFTFQFKSVMRMFEICASGVIL